MLWRLPATVRSLLVPNCRRHSSTSKRDADPLRILFCGSDEFSIKSLCALHHAQRHAPGLIDEIHVAHRPAKPTGRGLKTLREVPISQTARHLSLPTHTFDTFTGWSPPFSYNIVVAVSFGLLVPPRILGQASYGGLNVHPSLLPDLRGSAPIAHAILKQREYTGVSVQTLHPQHFDQGTILAQSLAPGVKIETNETAKQLEARLADIGADMLIDVLKSRSFVTPPQNVGWYAGPVDYAPKTTKQDRFIDFRTHTISEILAIQRALGDTWCLLPNGDRLIMHEMVSLDEVEVVNLGAIEKTGEPGLWVQDDSRVPLFRAACGRVGGLRKSTYAGGLAGKGNKKVKKLLQGKLSV